MMKFTAVVVGFVVAGLAALAWAGSIVDFDPGKVVFKDIDADSSYVEIQRPKDVDKNTQQTWNFATTQPLFSQGTPIYGGISIVCSAATLDSAGTFVRLHTNKPDAWPQKPLLFFQTSDTSGGTNQFNINTIFLWKKADFADVKADQKVKFDASSTLHVRIQDWYAADGDKTKPIDIRFVVKNGSKYYLSEASQTAASSTLDLTDFNNNSAAGKRWAEFSPTATDFTIPATPNYVAVSFDDVQEVGMIGQGSGAFARMYSIDQFSASCTK